MRSATLLRGVAMAGAAVVFMLSVGWWQTRDRAQDAAGVLPLSIDRMSFTLMDQNGKTVEPQDWLGRPTIVFFGFTWCPDICPTTLSDISGWLEALGPQADQMNTILISVDPERDTPEILGDYLSNFDPRITGLTGPLPQIKAGLNQTIMLSLSMVVIAALVGASGLGVPVLRALNSVNTALGFESGLVIVVLAIMLDRVLRVRSQS